MRGGGYINSSGPDIGCEENAGGSLSEILHDCIAFFLRHVAVHTRDCEICFSHFFSQPIHLSLRIAKDNCLCDRKSIIQLP